MKLIPWIRFLLLAFGMTTMALGRGPKESVEDNFSSPDQETQARVPIFRSGVSFVRVDAIVTDRDGNPVLDLTQDDFQIIEDGDEQNIQSFHLVEISGMPDPTLPPPSSIENRSDIEREAARSDTRVFVFFLDDYHVQYGNSRRVSSALMEFVNTQLYPTDLVGIMYPLTPVDEILFTRNHEVIAYALEQFTGIKGDYQPRNIYERRYANYPMEVKEKIRNEVSLSALRGLSTHLGGLHEGRKSVIVLSEGYSNYVPPQVRDQHFMAGGGGLNPQRYNPAAGDTHIEETTQFFEESSILSDLAHTAETANNNNTSFYMLDPRGLAISEYDASGFAISVRTDRRVMRSFQNTLHILAEETDGQAFLNSNNFSAGLNQIVSDQSAYYLLGYTPSNMPTDGKFHSIQVKVRRRGVRVRARKGYYALSPNDARRVFNPVAPPPRNVTSALSNLAEPGQGHYFRTWAGTRRGDNGRTQLTLVWEPIRRSIRHLWKSVSRVVLAVKNDDGTRLEEEVPKSAIVNNSLQVTFEVDPGELELNIGVEDTRGNVLDREIDEMVAPDFTAPEVTLSTPRVFRGQNPFFLRQSIANGDAMPAASRFFHRK